MLELRSAVSKAKRIIALIDNEASHGGLTLPMIQLQLHEAHTSYEKWGFDDDGLHGERLFEALFQEEPIEWNRIGAFQE